MGDVAVAKEEEEDGEEEEEVVWCVMWRRRWMLTSHSLTIWSQPAEMIMPSRPGESLQSET